jgi:hypothetical protein
MERLLRMDRGQFLREMRAEVERVLGQVADAVNDAPDGHVISGSEMRVRELMGELRTAAFQKAVQMRVDETEGAFSPSQGRVGPAQAAQGPGGADDADRQRADRGAAGAVARPRRGGRQPG